MKVEKDKIIIDIFEDYEFYRLIERIDTSRYGEIKIKYKNGIPYRIVRNEPGEDLTRKNNLRNPENYEY